MRNILFLVFCCSMFSCSENDDEIPFSREFLIGKWKNTEAYISAGGPHYWVSVDNGEEIEFLENGTFISNRFTECSTGIYTAEDGKLSLEYECDEFNPANENSEGFITSNLVFKKDAFLLSPTSGFFCIEGCQSKYLRVSSN